MLYLEFYNELNKLNIDIKLYILLIECYV